MSTVHHYVTDPDLLKKEYDISSIKTGTKASDEQRSRMVWGVGGCFCFFALLLIIAGSLWLAEVYGPIDDAQMAIAITVIVLGALAWLALAVWCCWWGSPNAQDASLLGLEKKNDLLIDGQSTLGGQWCYVIVGFLVCVGIILALFVQPIA